MRLDIRLAELEAEARSAGMEEGLAEGLEQGMEKGLEQGLEQGESRALLLVRELRAAGRLDDLARALEDAEYRRELYCELGVE